MLPLNSADPDEYRPFMRRVNEYQFWYVRQVPTFRLPLWFFGFLFCFGVFDGSGCGSSGSGGSVARQIHVGGVGIAQVQVDACHHRRDVRNLLQVC